MKYCAARFATKAIAYAYDNLNQLTSVSNYDNLGIKDKCIVDNRGNITEMKSIFLKIASFITHFDGFEFMYQNNAYVMYIIFFALSVSMIKDYLGSIYGIKKSEKKDKYIRKEYNIFQRILLIHWYQNIYKKVDRFWFDIIYHCYLVNLALFVLVMLLCLLCHYFDFLNMIAGILYVIHCIYMAAIGIVYFLGTKHSPSGGVEFRCAKKYRGKKWR